MLIANPIYDSVFKYLMDDNQVAKILISNIMGIKIEHLKLEPTETIVKSGSKDFNVFRIDFKATIQLENKEQKVILIELQKAKLESDILRFRRYLGTQYRDAKNVYSDASSRALPIHTIYLLGHNLDHSQSHPIINVQRTYIDNYSKEIITHKEEFIESLTHDSIVIQIPLFKIYRRNRLEKLLSIFESSTNHEIQAEETNDEEFTLITRRLVAANSDEKVRRQMDLEDEIISELASKDRQIQEAKEETEEAMKREEVAMKREEVAMKREEVAMKREEEERRQKEEERRQKEALQFKIQNAVRKFRLRGFSDAEIAEDLGLSLFEVEAIV